VGRRRSPAGMRVTKTAGGLLGRAALAAQRPARRRAERPASRHVEREAGGRCTVRRSGQARPWRGRRAAGRPLPPPCDDETRRHEREHHEICQAPAASPATATARAAGPASQPAAARRPGRARRAPGERANTHARASCGPGGACRADEMLRVQRGFTLQAQAHVQYGNEAATGRRLRSRPFRRVTQPDGRPATTAAGSSSERRIDASTLRRFDASTHRIDASTPRHGCCRRGRRRLSAASPSPRGAPFAARRAGRSLGALGPAGARARRMAAPLRPPAPAGLDGAGQGAPGQARTGQNGPVLACPGLVVPAAWRGPNNARTLGETATSRTARADLDDGDAYAAVDVLLLLLRRRRRRAQRTPNQLAP
jgi:hypothetical protein